VWVRSPAVVLVAVALVAVGTVIASLVTGKGSVWAFEVLAVLGILAGIAVALGGLDRVTPAWSGRGRASGVTRAVPWLAEATAAHLASLDPVEHRRLDLGSPWPAVVVGPTGVSVVHVAADPVGPCLDRIAEVVATVRAVVAQVSVAQQVDVQGLFVAAPGRVSRLPDGVRRVCPEQLDGALASGPLVPVSTVNALFARLSGQLETAGEPGRS
jgi:hypothetical protein